MKSGTPKKLPLLLSLRWLSMMVVVHFSLISRLLSSQISENAQYQVFKKVWRCWISYIFLILKFALGFLDRPFHLCGLFFRGIAACWPKFFFSPWYWALAVDFTDLLGAHAMTQFGRLTFCNIEVWKKKVDISLEKPNAFWFFRWYI